MITWPSGLARGPTIGRRRMSILALTEPAGWNWLTTVRTSGGSAARNAASIGTDSAWIFRRTSASGPGLSMVPFMTAGRSPIRPRRSTASRWFSSFRLPPMCSTW